jgi:hypothetical protein
LQFGEIEPHVRGHRVSQMLHIERSCCLSQRKRFEGRPRLKCDGTRA